MTERSGGMREGCDDEGKTLMTKIKRAGAL